ncbi:MAG: YcxB-like protein [Acidobacteriota bacterium]|nr:YcxB-like protein [Acidobacteriota bacterium]
MEAITLHFKLTEEEYLDASRVFTFRSRESKIRAVVAYVLFAIGASLLFLAYDFSLESAAALGVLLLAGFFGLWHLNQTAMLRRFYRGDPKFGDAVTLTFADEGVAAKTKDVDSKVSWSLYTEAIETARCYILVYGKDVRMMTAIPKRVFTGREQELAFRNLLSSHLRGKLELRPADGEAIKREYEPSSLDPPDWR